MKNIIKSRIMLLTVMIGYVMLMASCEKDMIKDAAYPDQLIYMPAATYNNYIINTVPTAVGSVPTSGYPARFTIDTIARKMNVLLGVYRSGIDLKGSFVVNVAANTDTINKLLTIPGKLPTGTLLLPADKYTIPASVEMKDGAELSKFELAVDLNYLLAKYPAQSFAIAVGISSEARKTNPLYATTIIVIDTKIMKPTASFTAVPLVPNSKTINFKNTSKFGTKFIWNFGDGSPVKVTTTMVNEEISHTYATAGSYNVTLTVVGVADYADRSVATKVQVVL